MIWSGEGALNGRRFPIHLLPRLERLQSTAGQCVTVRPERLQSTAVRHRAAAAAPPPRSMAARAAATSAASASLRAEYLPASAIASSAARTVLSLLQPTPPHSTHHSVSTLILCASRSP
jgi:hypothetical protein